MGRRRASSRTEEFIAAHKDSKGSKSSAIKDHKEEKVEWKFSRS